MTAFKRCFQFSTCAPPIWRGMKYENDVARRALENSRVGVEFAAHVGMGNAPWEWTRIDCKKLIMKQLLPAMQPYVLKTHGGAVQVDPGFSKLTLRLVSALETKI